MLLNPVAEVHAQGGFEYTLSSSQGVTLVPGGSGSTTIIATLTGGGTASNVTLFCDLTNLPTGTTCSFTPTSVIPTAKGTTTTLTIAVPATTPYSAFKVTVNGKITAPIAPTIFTLTVAAKIAMNPTATASLSYTPTVTQPNPSFTVELNITNSPPFAGFIIGVFYNYSVLRVLGIDYSRSVLGSDAVVSDECVDYKCSQGIPDIRYDRVGVASLVLFTNSGQNATLPTGSSTINGNLFTVTFGVISKGFSAIHFVHQELQPPSCNYCSFIPLQSVGYDGYFTNEDCGGGNLCKPPIVSFIPPVRPIALRPVYFNATAVSQNPGGVIREYNWTSGGGQDVQYYNSPSAKGATLWTNITITFLNIGEHEVTLSAQDKFGARAYFTLSIVVFRVWIDLGISALSIDPTVGVFPGTIVHIVATATNNGVNPDNSTLRVSINNQNVATQSIVNLGPVLQSSLSYDWNTAGVTPRVYRVDVALDEVRNPTTSQILENDTAIIRGQLVDPNNMRVAFVQLIEPVPSGIGVFLGLNLPETLGLGIVLIAVIVFATGLVRKSRARSPEPL